MPDAEGDGDMDLLTASLLLLWRNVGQSKLVPQTLPIPAAWERDVATGHVDGDGDVDSVLSSSYRLGLALNNGQGHWHFAEVPQKLAGFNQPYKRVALADVDHDVNILSPGKGLFLQQNTVGEFVLR